MLPLQLLGGREDLGRITQSTTHNTKKQLKIKEVRAHHGRKNQSKSTRRLGVSRRLSQHEHGHRHYTITERTHQREPLTRHATQYNNSGNNSSNNNTDNHPPPKRYNANSIPTRMRGFSSGVYMTQKTYTRKPPLATNANAQKTMTMMLLLIPLVDPLSLSRLSPGFPSPDCWVMS